MRVPKEVEKAICKEYESDINNSLPILSKKYGFSTTTIHNVLKRSGVTTRSIKESLQKTRGRRLSDEVLLNRIRSKVKSYSNRFSDLDVRDDFGYYFAGFVDGEGSFVINGDFRHRENYKTTFSINLREDDRKILEYFRDTLKVGNIRDNIRSQENKEKWNIEGENPKVIWEVADYCELYYIIIPLLEKYPLRAKKKEDFEIWSNAIKTRCESQNYQHIIDELRNAYVGLKEQRTYKEG